MNPRRHRNHGKWRRDRLAATPAAIALGPRPIAWPDFWRLVQSRLRQESYSPASMRLYRHVLRKFSRWFYSTPDRVTAGAVRSYIYMLTARHSSWAWTSVNISALRLAFDRVCGLSVCGGLVTPKRPRRLPECLSRDEVWRLLAAADTARDQLLLGLMYGCGLKVGELCGLRWSDVDCEGLQLSIRSGAKTRLVALPSMLAPILEKGRSICPPEEYIFRGAVSGTHLSTRMAEYVLRRAAAAAKMDKPVCGMTLRHSYAIHRLRDGASIREIQESLGLASIHTAMVYARCLLPAGAHSPLDTPAGANGDGSSDEPGNIKSASRASHDVQAEFPVSSPGHLSVPAPQLPVELPFQPVTVSLTERARLFYRSLRLHIRGRFLALRHATAPP